MKKEQNEIKNFLEQLLSSPDFLKEKKIFDCLSGEKTIWWLVGRKINTKSLFALPFDKKKSTQKDKFLQCLIKNIKNNLKGNQPVRFACEFGLYGLFLPLACNEEIDAFLGICHVGKDLPPIAIENLNTAIKIIADKLKKEQELVKLHETLRPRAIALSTVHTVHRLIGSTLNLAELLPRIARLSLQVLRAKKCAIMLVDQLKKIIMPQVYIDINKKSNNLRKLPVNSKIERKVLRTGKIFFDPRYICVPLIAQEIIGTIRVEDRQDNKPFTNSDQEILTVLGEQAVIAIKNAQLYEDRGRMLLGSIKSLATILDTRSPDTYTHPIGFVEIVLEIGKELKLSEEEMESLKYAALLLDAGKIGIPDEILMKPTKLTGKEYKIIKEHPIKGAEIVGSIEAMKPAIPLIMHHHERCDGTGYPLGLKKNEIPLGARIIAVADAFEAMICKRPYKASLKIKEAVEEIKKSSGTQFDPFVVNAFLNLVKRGKIKNIVCRLQKKMI